MRKADIQGATDKAQAQATGPIDLPEFVCDQRGGTITLQLNTPTIVTGGTVPENLVSAKAEAGSVIQLYYIVTARLLESEGEKE